MTTPSAWDVLEGTTLPRGHRVEIAAGRIVMTPRREAGRQAVLAASPQIEAQLAGRGVLVADARIDFPSADHGYAPDLAVLAPGAAPGRRGRYSWRVIEAAFDVVPRPEQDHDYVRKLRFLSECGVPLYVVVDPVEALCTVHSDPQRAGAYREAERVPFGSDLYLPLADRTLVIGTGDFPAEPPRAATPEAGPGRARGTLDG
ncbi:Uma2 family endonuclease [Kitasatospora sp. NBC_00315]|uniref:Uma2 family endonuclease n=1 Tax=Kitasatospora sp. NBC_00315 TaxID=2975963 RepID=UPI00324B7E6B